jgi:hypothetical protein
LRQNGAHFERYVIALSVVSLFIIGRFLHAYFCVYVTVFAAQRRSLRTVVLQMYCLSLLFGFQVYVVNDEHLLTRTKCSLCQQLGLCVMHGADVSVSARFRSAVAGTTDLLSSSSGSKAPPSPTRRFSYGNLIDR